MKNRKVIQPILFLAMLAILILPANATKHTVQAGGVTFSPDTLSGVEIGDTIRWEWLNSSHTTTSVTIPTGAAEWNNPLTETSNFFEYKVTVAGTYTYKCIPHEASGMKGVFIVDQTSQIIAPAKFSGETIKVFPNPVQESFTITFSEDHSVVGEVRLINLVGGRIQSWILETSIGIFSRSFQVGTLPRGIYFVEIHSDGKRVATRKIIKE